MTTHQPSPLRCSCSDMTPPFRIFRALPLNIHRTIADDRAEGPARVLRSGACRSTFAPKPSDYAPAVLVPGDPRRAKYIAETFFDPGFRLVNEERGALGFTGTFQGKPISVQSVGMGCASAGIYYNELIQLGATRIIRVGTAGGLAPSLRLADTVVAISATADDPVVGQMTQGEAHAPTASWTLVESAVNRARELGAPGARRPHRVGRAVLRPSPGHHAALGRPRPPRRGDGGGHALHARRRCTRSRRSCLAPSATSSSTSTHAERISDDDMKIGVDRMMQVACDGRRQLTLKLGSDEAEVLHGVALLDELGGAGVDLAAAELVDVEALDDRVLRRPCTCTGSCEMRPSGTP